MTAALTPVLAGSLHDALQPLLKTVQAPDRQALDAVLAAANPADQEANQATLVSAVGNAFLTAVVVSSPQPWFGVTERLLQAMDPVGWPAAIAEMLEQLVEMDLYTRSAPFHDFLRPWLPHAAPGAADRVVEVRFRNYGALLAPHLPLLLPYTTPEASAQTIVAALHASRPEMANALWHHHGPLALPVKAYCETYLAVPQTNPAYLYFCLEIGFDDERLDPALRVAVKEACRSIRPAVAEDRYRAEERMAALANHAPTSTRARRRT